MKILELEIENIRGIRSLQIKPDGRNVVIWGPNGTGKSAVVDAIDFLLTGRVTRLTGPGTGGITLRRHGPHIDTSPEQAIVRALVEIPGLSDPIEISRSMDRPGVLVYDEDRSAYLQPVLEIAKRKQHILSRREILRFITAESSTRAEGIQELLDLSEVENVRRALVRVMNDADREVTSSQRNISNTEAMVNATVQIDEFREEQVIGFVNQNREILGADPISCLRSEDLKKGISLPTSIAGERTINVSVIERDIQNIKTILSPSSQDSLGAADRQLRSLLTSIRSDPEDLRLLQKRKLIELGLALLDDSGTCPLCEKYWPPEELKTHLEAHLRKAKAAGQLQKQILDLSSSILKSINKILPSLGKLSASLEAASLAASAEAMRKWIEALRSVAGQLSNPVAEYPSEEYSVEEVARLLSPIGIDAQLDDALADLRKKYPEVSPEQTAWDLLTRLEENLKALESAQRAHEGASMLQRIAHALHDHFVSARDEVLEDLYNQISSRFSEFYTHLHGPDEDEFEARIEPDRAGLALEVNFYGRGIHPPHALHSEGHQDSMGICLYLALAERLTKGLIGLTVLDDVVMSVDSTHRRRFCTLLSEHFPDKQFLITTHDRTWANQLRSEGIVSKKDMIEFYNWDIDTGPYVDLESDLWQRVGDFLRSNDVSSAAALMRKGSEEFFAYVCDSLEAPVRFRLDGRNELGDYLPSAYGRYISLLKQAKKSAQSWSRKEKFERLNELSSTASQIYQRTLAEQWAVNATVHYNNWANLSRDDFIPVKEAFQDLHALFICQNCGSVLRLAKQGVQLIALRCDCGQVDWNLLAKISE